MILKPTTIADFDCYGIKWQCFVRTDGTYVWRTRCGRYSVWRDGPDWFAARGDKVGGKKHPNAKAAMWSAQNEPPGAGGALKHREAAE